MAPFGVPSPGSPSAPRTERRPRQRLRLLAEGDAASMGVIVKADAQASAEALAKALAALEAFETVEVRPELRGRAARGALPAPRAPW